MGLESYKASAPGSLMLFGEHAVLHGKMALVAAVNKYIHATLVPRVDKEINIVAPAIGALKTSLNRLKSASAFAFVLAAIEHEKIHLHSGFDIFIESEFPTSLGLGSSAAVTVAVLAVLKQWHNKVKTTQPTKAYLTQVLVAARQVVRKVQGLGSGADVAASVFGGVVQYRSRPLLIRRIATALPLTVIYSGRKIPTAQVVAQVEKLRAKNRSALAAVDNAIEQCVKDAAIAIKQKHWEHLGEIANIHQGLQDALGVNNTELATIIFALRNTNKIYGAKISGSGLGDCVIGIGAGHTHPKYVGVQSPPRSQLVDVGISATGIHVVGARVARPQRSRPQSSRPQRSCPQYSSSP